MADLGTALQSLLQVPGLQELLNQAITQQRQLQPLRTAVNQQALNMLPNSAFPGQSPSGLGTRPNLGAIAPANFVTPAPGTDWSKILPMLAAGGGIANALAKAFGDPSKSGGTNLVNLLRNIFGGKGAPTGPQGNQNRVPNLTYDPTDAGFQGWAPYGTDLGDANVVNNTFTGWATPTPNVTTSESFPGITYPEAPDLGPVDPMTLPGWENPGWNG